MIKYYTPEEVAEIFRVKTRTVWEWLRTGKLQSVKVGRQYRITIKQINNFRYGREAKND